MNEKSPDIKLNLGCGGRPLQEYINVDSDDLETLKHRYPQQQFPDELVNAFDVALSEGRNSERVQAGLERVRRYSWNRTAAQTLEVYRGIC